MTTADAPKPAVLLVEDDENLRIALEDNLSEEGYAVDAARDCAEARRHVAARPHDVAIVDVMLPDGDGYALCREFKTSAPELRVLLLTARSLEDDIVRGFDAGADDYVVKPYRLRELLARIRALLRRSVVVQETLRFKGFELDLAARTVSRPDGRRVELTRTEFDLLALFVRSAGRALSRDAILDAVWGADVVVDTHTVDNFVLSLRRKLGWTEKAPFRFQSVRGVGYRMDLDP